MANSVRDLQRELERGEPGPVYLLTSPEPVLLDEAIRALRAVSLTAAPDFNRDEFRVGETAVGRVVDAATTLPMMSHRRWVHLTDVHKLKAKDMEPLAAYAAAPCPSTVLCLSGQKLEKRSKAGKAITKAAQTYQFDPPKQWELERWLEDRASQLGYDITRDAASLLADMVGTDLGGIDRSLDKLWIFAGAKGAIELEHVEALVAPTRVHSIFELADAIGERDLSKASVLLRNAIDSGEAALRVLAMITRQFRLLLRVKALGGRPNPATISKELRIAPFLARNLAKQAEQYRAAELWRALSAAARADLRVKSSRLNHGVVLDRLLVDVMGSRS